MPTVIELPPRADPDIASPHKTPQAPYRIWLAVLQQQLQRAVRQGRHYLRRLTGDPGRACAYTMLVASDIRPDAYGTEL
jgi:hypothetical protein